MRRQHVVQYSGGLGSWMAAKRVVDRYGTDDVHLMFMDVQMEDPDSYRFLHEGAERLGLTVTTVTEGRNPWQVYFDKRFMGGAAKAGDPCSRILKREAGRKFLDENFDAATDFVYIGMGWDERHRLAGPMKNWLPWRVKYPLAQKPFLFHHDIVAELHSRGIEIPELYRYSPRFSHGNCGGFCIKAGQGHFAMLLKRYPGRYAFHEDMEQKFRAHVGKDVAILKDRRGGETKPMTLKTLRELIESEPEQIDLFDMGSCHCMGED